MIRFSTYDRCPDGHVPAPQPNPEGRGKLLVKGAEKIGLEPPTLSADFPDPTCRGSRRLTLRYPPMRIWVALVTTIPAGFALRLELTNWV